MKKKGNGILNFLIVLIIVSLLILLIPSFYKQNKTEEKKDKIFYNKFN